jgi:hypothetical protein
MTPGNERSQTPDRRRLRLREEDVVADRKGRFDVRSWAFRVAAGLVAVLFIVVFNGVSAAVHVWTGNAEDPHAWHEVLYGAMSGILVGGALLASLRRPRERVGAFRFFIVASLLLMGGELWIQGLQPGLIFTWLVLLGPPLALYPRPSRLLRFRGGRVDAAMLGLVGASLLVLVPDIVRNIGREVGRIGGEHLTEGHWVTAVTASLALVVLGLVAAFEGSRSIGPRLVLVTAWGVLGSAAVTVPESPGSWGVIGGILALVVAAGYGALAIAAAREHLPAEPSERRRVPVEVPY